jgi:hypothetical protein
MATLVGLVPGVGPDVLLQVGELGELPLADLAAVGLDAQVDPHMLRQIWTVGKGLAALAALVGLRLPHVHLGVQLQVSFGSEYLKQEKTMRTWNLYSKNWKLIYFCSPVECVHAFPNWWAKDDLERPRGSWLRGGEKLIIGKTREAITTTEKEKN